MKCFKMKEGVIFRNSKLDDVIKDHRKISSQFFFSCSLLFGLKKARSRILTIFYCVTGPYIQFHIPHQKQKREEIMAGLCSGKKKMESMH